MVPFQIVSLLVHPIDKLIVLLDIDLSHVSLLQNQAVLAIVIWPSALRKMEGLVWRVGPTRLTVTRAETLSICPSQLRTVNSLGSWHKTIRK